MRSWLVLAALPLILVAALGNTSVALADPADGLAPVVSASAPRVPQAHSIYVELLGKGGLWGLGYDYQFHRRVGVGATASFFIVGGERVLTFSPYLVGYLLGTHRHRWFVQGGPQLSYVYTPSPVPEWPGASATGIGVELCSGYEYRRHVLVRVFAMSTLGKGGFAPWMGVSLGWTL